MMIISFSINMANVVWDNAGSSMIEHSQQGVIDNHPPFIDEESMSLIMPLLKAIIGQEIDTRQGLLKVENEYFPNNGYTATPRRIRVVNGRYVTIESPTQGQITIHVIPHSSKSLGDLGSIIIPFPQAGIENGIIKKRVLQKR